MGGLYAKMGDVAAGATGILSLHLLISHVYELSPLSCRNLKYFNVCNRSYESNVVKPNAMLIST